MASSVPANTPVIIGAAQITPRGDDPHEPLDLWEAACRAALADAGIVDPSTVQATRVASCRAWRYDDQGRRLAERLKIPASTVEVCEPGGSAGQLMLDRLSTRIRSSTLDVGLVCGGEAMASLRRLKRQGRAPDWSFPHPDGQRFPFDLDAQQHPDEVAAGLTQGIGTVYSYAMRDIARRARLGTAPAAYRLALAETLSGMTRVAAGNPRAWFPVARSPQFIAELRDDNRMVSYPYSKHMVAMMDVDMAAAFVVASEAWADRMGIPQSARVYPLASCYVDEPDYIAVRDDLAKSPGMEIAAGEVLSATGLTIEQVDFIDFYSCFPSSVMFASDALGIAPDGEHITLTGGLPYAGGPASSYVLTSIVAAVHALRSHRGGNALISGMSMWMAKQCYAAYSSSPPGAHVRPADSAAAQARYDALPRRTIRSGYVGPATVATYTIMYDRAGQRTRGVAICDTPSNERCYANVLDPELLRQLECEECVGLAVMLTEANPLPVVTRMDASARDGLSA